MQSTTDPDRSTEFSEAVYICIGTNIGDRHYNVNFAIERLRNLSTDGRCAVSPIYETQPWGPVEQAPFLNCAARILTLLNPHSLHRKLLVIERESGRKPERERWGPRELDLDILLFGDRVVHSLQLTIPHPRLTQRRFVLVPLYDLIPDEIIPFFNISVRDALNGCLDSGWVKKYIHEEPK